MKKRGQWVVLFIICAVLGVVLTQQLLRSSWPLRRLIAHQVEKNAPQIKVESVNIADHFFNDRKEFLIKTLSLNFRFEEKDYLFVIDEIRFFEWANILSAGRPVELSITGAHLMSPAIHVSNGGARLRVVGGKKEIAGHVTIPYIVYQNIAVSSFDASLFIDSSRVSLNDIHADLMKGVINGKFVLEYKDDMSYSMDIMLKGIETMALPSEVGVIEKQVKALVNGSLTLQGNARAINELKMDLNAPQGAFVNPQLLQLLTSYLPRSTQKERLDEIIRQGESVYLDKFNLSITNKNKEQIKTAFDMKSNEFNLDIKLGVDINVDAGILELLRSSLQFFPKENL